MKLSFFMCVCGLLKFQFLSSWDFFFFWVRKHVNLTSGNLALLQINVEFPCVFQVPLAPLQRGNGPPFLNQMWQNESHGIVNHPSEQGIPVMITWNYGGNNVAVEGSWDNWTSR